MIHFYLILLTLALNLCHGPLDCRITTYTPTGITADGTRLDGSGEQRVCAVSRRAEAVFPMGSIVYVEGHGFYRVADRTAGWLRRFKRPTVDLAVWGEWREYRGVWLVWRGDE